MDVAVHQVAGPHQDHRLGHQVGHAHPLSGGQRAVVAYADDGPAQQQAGGLELGRHVVALQAGDQAEVEASSTQALVDRRLLCAEDPHLGRRGERSELDDGGGEDRNGGGVDSADADDAADRVLRGGGPAEAIDRIDHPDDVRQQLASLVGDLRARAAALEDRHPELALEVAAGSASYTSLRIRTGSDECCST